MNIHKNSKRSIRLPLYISITLCIGVFIGINMSGITSIPTLDSAKNAHKFRQVLTHIKNDYVDEVDIDALTENAISSMLEKLDPHTTYIPAKELELIKYRLEDHYEGIGIEFNIFKDTIHVILPLSGGPSQKLGIRSGDKIIQVDGKLVAGIGITNQKVVETLRGPNESEVTVSIQRKGEKKLIHFTIKRGRIPQNSIDVSYMVNDKVGYIKIARFAYTTYAEFKKALRKLKSQGMEKLVLDLTGNQGGYLNRAIQITDELLADKQMIVYTKGKEKKHMEEYYSGEKGDFETGSLVIMIDQGSASASEIVSGAIQDHDRGLIVGRRSFGKGLVQLPIDLHDGSELRLTISRYYTPSGRNIQKTYTEGELDDYYSESYQRYTTGEMYSLDSTKFHDSLAFKTDNGRFVYGGWGIHPDVFVSLDTTETTSYLNRLFSTNTLQEYTIKYVQENREKLLTMDFKDFKTSFEVSDKMFKKLIAIAEENGLSYNEKEFNHSKKTLKILTKAYIGRGLWEGEGFYSIFNEQNEIYMKAILLIDEVDKLIKKP